MKRRWVSKACELELRGHRWETMDKRRCFMFVYAISIHTKQKYASSCFNFFITKYEIENMQLANRSEVMTKKTQSQFLSLVFTVFLY